MIIILNLSNYNVDWPGDEAYAKKNPTADLNQQDCSRPLTYTMFSKDPLRDNNNQKQQRIHYRDYQPRNVSSADQNGVKDDRLASMKNRYFSIENQVNEAEKQDNKKEEDSEEAPSKSDPTTTQAFLQRKDYLLKKLMAAHTLPGLEENSSTTTTADNDSKETVPKSAARPMRVSTFHDEFIPLFSVNSNSEKNNDNANNSEQKSETSESSSSEEDVKVVKGDKEYNPKVNNLQNYQGPYSIDCILRSRRVLIEELLPMSTSTNRSNYFDRRWEILKMKLDIKSKFDTDRRLRNKIQRETAQIQQQLADRASVRDRRFNYYNGRATNGARMNLYDEYVSLHKQRSKSLGSKKVFNDSDGDDDVLFFDDETNSYKSTNSKWKSSENFIELAKGKKRGNNSNTKLKSTKISSMTLDENSPESDGDSSNEEEVIRMINQQEYCLNAGTDDSEDMDSKCRQFGKYGKKQRSPSPSTTSKKKLSKKRPNLNKPEPNLKRRKSAQAKETAKHGPEDEDNFDGRVRIDRVGLVPISQYEELKERYKTIRNKRNKVLRKKKGEKIELERKVMSDELRTIRAQLKKLRRKNKSLMDQDQLTTYNPLDLVKNKDSKKPKKRILQQKKQQNFQSNQENKRVKKKIKKNKKNDHQNSMAGQASTSRAANKKFNGKDSQPKKGKNNANNKNNKGRVRTNKASSPGRMKTRLWYSRHSDRTESRVK